MGATESCSNFWPARTIIFIPTTTDGPLLFHLPSNLGQPHYFSLHPSFSLPGLSASEVDKLDCLGPTF